MGQLPLPLQPFPACHPPAPRLLPMELSFHTLDVFTDRTFGGNPLGVFAVETTPPLETMQRIAREMSLSETVFVSPPETPEGTARVRIFTPVKELPFAGHPTVGTAIHLASPGTDTAGLRMPSLPRDGEVTIVLEENVGPVPVVVKIEAGLPVFARFTTAVLPEHRPSPHADHDLAAMIGLDPEEIGGTDAAGTELRPEMVSCGVPNFVIPVRTIESVRACVLDAARWKQLLADEWADHVYVVCLDGEGQGVDVRVRMFAPGSGVPEDPATGSAAAALGGYLSKVHGGDEASLAWTVEQGIEMGRPSIIHVEADRAAGRTTAVRVGGGAVPVSRGFMRVPAQ